jgi:hypothetical protein
LAIGLEPEGFLSIPSRSAFTLRPRAYSLVTLRGSLPLLWFWPRLNLTSMTSSSRTMRSASGSPAGRGRQLARIEERNLIRTQSNVRMFDDHPSYNVMAKPGVGAMDQEHESVQLARWREAAVAS